MNRKTNFNNNLKVSKHLICYIDILGYKDLINSITNEDDVLFLIDSSFKECIKRSKMAPGLDIEISINIFSDNILFSTKINENNISDILLKIEKMILFISIFQSLLITHYQTFIRGSLTIGNLYVDKELGYVFGKGLINAYNLENEKAIYPRIILDDSIKKILIDNNKITIQTMYDNDGFYFINYLYYNAILLCNRQWDSEAHPIILQEFLKHKENVIESAKLVENNEHVLRKYIWAAGYHNTLCKMMNIDEVCKETNLIFSIDKKIFQDMLDKIKKDLV